MSGRTRGNKKRNRRGSRSTGGSWCPTEGAGVTITALYGFILAALPAAAVNDVQHTSNDKDPVDILDGNSRAAAAAAAEHRTVS
jgi:hypothetical protein